MFYNADRLKELISIGTVTRPVRFQQFAAPLDTIKQKYKRDTVFVYLDTSIPSFLIRDHRTEPEIVEMQEVTSRLWKDKRFQFVISQRVIDEIQAGRHPDKVKLRLQAIEKLGILEITEEVEFLAELLLQTRVLPVESGK